MLTFRAHPEPPCAEPEKIAHAFERRALAPSRLTTIRGVDQRARLHTQARPFPDAPVAYRHAGAAAREISPDIVASHKQFAGMDERPFMLLADPNCKVFQAYGMRQEKTLYGQKRTGVERTTFVIEAPEMVERAFAKVKGAGRVEAVLATVKAVA